MQKGSGTAFALALSFLLIATALQAIDDPAEVAGEWVVTLSFGGNTRDATLVLEQDGSSLTGTWVGMEGSPRDVTGMVDENSISFDFEVSGRGGRTFTISFEGNVEGETMSGSMQFGDAPGDGEWSAKRPE